MTKSPVTSHVRPLRMGCAYPPPSHHTWLTDTHLDAGWLRASPVARPSTIRPAEHCLIFSCVKFIIFIVRYPGVVHSFVYLTVRKACFMISGHGSVFYLYWLYLFRLRKILWRWTCILSYADTLFFKLVMGEHFKLCNSLPPTIWAKLIIITFKTEKKTTINNCPPSHLYINTHSLSLSTFN